MSQMLGMNDICTICGKQSTIMNPCSCHTPHPGFHEMAYPRGPFVMPPEVDPAAPYYKKCPYCRKVHNDLYVCESHPIAKGIEKVIPPVDDSQALKELHDELGTLEWFGTDDSWGKAIAAVRKHIRKKLS